MHSPEPYFCPNLNCINTLQPHVSLLPYPARAWLGYVDVPTRGETCNEEADAGRGARRVVCSHGLRDESGRGNCHRRRRSAALSAISSASGGGKVAATLAGAVIGGIVGNEIGRKLDDRDRQLAREAEYDAWERGPPGRPVRWRNPDNGRYGEIVAEDYYQRGSSRCRNFVHKVWIDGRPQAMRGTACRNPDGTWTQVS